MRKYIIQYISTHDRLREIVIDARSCWSAVAMLRRDKKLDCGTVIKIRMG
jgi:hypothetical protein